MGGGVYRAKRLSSLSAPPLLPSPRSPEFSEKPEVLSALVSDENDHFDAVFLGKIIIEVPCSQ